MPDPSTSPEERYAALAEALLASPNVARSNKAGFGRGGLWFKGKIFVLLVQDQLVVKFSEQRVDELVAAGAGERYAPSQGRLMKEWLALGPGSDWLPFAREAMEYVASPR